MAHIEHQDTQDTILLYHFNEGFGSAIRDSAASADRKRIPAKLIGSPRWVEGKFGTGLLLDGKCDAIDFGSSLSVFGVPLWNTMNAGSVELWFSVAKDIDGPSVPSVLIDCSQSPQIGFNANGEIEVTWYVEDWRPGNLRRLTSGFRTWKAGEWHHALFTWNENGHTLFVDETPLASDRLPDGVLIGSKNVTLGACFDGENRWSGHFAGKVDELRIAWPKTMARKNTTEKLPSGVIKETRHIEGTITGHALVYEVYYLSDRTNMPVFMHQYAGERERTGKVNARVAEYGIFSLLFPGAEDYNGYDLQDYKDAIDDVFRNYADIIDIGNVAIMGASYGGITTYGMATHFPYLFDIAIPVFGPTDLGYDDENSWLTLVRKNSPQWNVQISLIQAVGNHPEYRNTRYLVRNVVFAAKNNPYAHFEILHDISDGDKCSGVQVDLSRQYIAELNRLGYDNYNYIETPKEGYLYPKSEHWPEHEGQPIRYTHSFYGVTTIPLHYFELNVLKPALLQRKWQRPAFKKRGVMFIPTFLEGPHFRFDLGTFANNCDEGADVCYDVSSPETYRFDIIPKTAITKGKLRLMKLHPETRYSATFRYGDTENAHRSLPLKTDIHGSYYLEFGEISRNSHLVIECSHCTK